MSDPFRVDPHVEKKLKEEKRREEAEAKALAAKFAAGLRTYYTDQHEKHPAYVPAKWIPLPQNRNGLRDFD